MKTHIFFAVVCTLHLIAGEPEWVENNGKCEKYPDSLYLTGYGFSQIAQNNDKSTAQNTATEYARKSLIEKVKVQIQSVTYQKTEESGDKFSSMYSSATQSTSSLELQGLETETYFDKTDEIQYVFVYANRNTILNFYRDKVKILKQQIVDKKKEAELFEHKGKTSLALDAYIACLPLSRQLEEAQTIKSFIKISNAAAELQTDAGDNEVSLSKIRESIVKLVQRPFANTDDIAWYLSYLLKEQLDQRSDITHPSVMVAPLYYQDTKMGSSFSRYFKQVLENKLIEVGKMEVLQQGSDYQFTSSDPARDYAKAAGAKYVLYGSYWDQGGNIKFIVNIRSVTDGKILASAEVLVDGNVLSQLGKSLKPENYHQVLIDQKVFSKDEIAGGGLSLEAWTNRGLENVMFAENDTLTVTVRVNYPSYIRFIYHMANGKRVLLLDNYYMDQSKVNVSYQIPDEFICSSPFGGEILQVFASSEKYSELATEKIDGYNILKEELKKIVTATRGFKKITPNMMQAEQRIQITTMKE
jgi:TolB-like protein